MPKLKGVAYSAQYRRHRRFRHGWPFITQAQGKDRHANEAQIVIGPGLVAVDRYMDLAGCDDDAGQG